MTDKQQQWDQVLGDKLRQLQPDFRAESWDALADRLEQDKEADTTASADAIIAAAMNKIEPQFTTDSWDVLSARLDAEEVAFDAEVTSAMERIHPPHRANSWAALAARLELEAHRRISIWQTKSLELMTSFVLLLAFWVFFPYFQPDTNLPASDQAQSIAALATPPTDVAHGAVSTPVDTENIIDRSSIPVDASTVPPASKALDQSLKQSGERATRYAMAENSRTTPTSKTIRTATVEQLPADRIPKLPVASGRAKLPAQGALDQDAVALLNTPGVTAFNTESANLELSRKLRRTRSPLVQTWGLIGTHWDQNVVFTPSFTLQRTFPSSTRMSRGTTIGATYSRGRGRHRGETGLLYRLKQYYPSYVVRNDKRERSVNHMRYHSVSIPLNYQYALVRIDRLSAYLNIGASFNMTLAAHIDIEDIYLNSLSNLAGPRSEEARRADNFGEHHGLLQGGKLSNNATLYTLLGAGVEYRWPGGLSLFVQPTVTRRIIDFGQDGEGPLLERINSNSVLFGFKREF